MECRSGVELFSGAVLGAATMYFFDPEQGRRRRASCMAEVNQLLHGDRGGVEGASATDRPTLAPETRLLFGALGAGLFTWGLTQRAPTACLLGSLGLAFAWPAAVGHGPGPNQHQADQKQVGWGAAERRTTERPTPVARRREREPVW
jgi:hypothetical protein